MKNLRKYGNAPFKIAVIHGGPGGAGHMAPVARELAHSWSVLEPLQTANSIKGQVEELRTVLEMHGTCPVTLVGSSWGAMLSYIMAARYPSLVEKLILVGSGVYEGKYAAGIHETRLKRLNEDEQQEVHALMEKLHDKETEDKDNILASLLKKFIKTDTCNLADAGNDKIKINFNIHKNVWDEAVKLRDSGKLLHLGKKICCPVVAIHGDYDPHPAEGVEKPLATVLKDFKFILLEKCGHLPWIEKEARDRFFNILKEELS
jgi:pimeloyl-ACP methyl ester carboxylesterase